MIEPDPDQIDAVGEWQRLVDDPERGAALVRAAGDWASPQRTAVLRLLYRLVGESTHAGSWLPHARPAVDAVVELARGSSHPALKRFVARAEALAADAERFDHYRWCDGGFVFEDTVRGNEPAAEIAAAMLDGRVGVVEGSRRIAELVRYRGDTAPELQPFLSFGAADDAVGPKRRHRAPTPAANDAEPVDHEQILRACHQLVASGGAAVAY